MGFFSHRRALLSLGSDYELVMSVNWCKDKNLDIFRVERINPAFNEKVWQWPDSGSFMKFLDSFTVTVVHNDDRVNFRTTLRRENMLEKFERYNVLIVDMRLLIDRTYRYYGVKLTPLRSGNRITGFAMGLYDINELMHDELHSAEVKQRHLLDFFTENYQAVHRRNLDDDTFVVVKTTEYLDAAYAGERFWMKSFRRYCEMDVLRADCEMLYEAASTENIRKCLEDRRSFEVRYRDITAGEPKWWVMRVNRLVDQTDEVVVAFTENDEEIRREIDRETKLDTAKENFAALESAIHALVSSRSQTDLSAFLSIVVKRFHAACCYLMVFDFQTGTVRVGPGRAVTADGRVSEEGWTGPLKPFECQFGILAESGIVDVGQAEARYVREAAGYSEGMFPAGLGRHLATSVIVKGRLVGTLNVDLESDRPLDEMEIENLRRLTDILGSAIERQQVYSSLKESGELAKREELFSLAMVDASPVPTFLKDADDEYKYIRCNRAFAELFEREQRELVGLTDWDLEPPKRISMVRGWDEKALASSEPIVYEDEIPVGVLRRLVKMRVRKCAMMGPEGHRYVIGFLLP